MKDPIKWFEEAVSSGKYQKDLIDQLRSCISQGRFNIDKLMDWVSKQLEKSISEE